MKNKIFLFLFFIIITQFVGLIGSFFTMPNIKSWYFFLKKPSFSPPNWVFAPVWTVLYLLMGISAFLIFIAGFEKEEQKKETKIALIFYFVQLLINIIWSFVFFEAKNLFLSFLTIIILWFFILFTLIKFWKIRKNAGILLIPYLFWVSFALVLNLRVWQLNL